MRDEAKAVGLSVGGAGSGEGWRSLGGRGRDDVACRVGGAGGEGGEGRLRSVER